MSSPRTSRRRLTSHLVFLAILLLAWPIARAFKVDEAGHLGITSDALRTIQRVVDGIAYRFTDRALEEIRAEVADLTLIAATKVTGKSLSGADHKRLIEDAIRELDFSALEGSKAEA